MSVSRALFFRISILVIGLFSIPSFALGASVSLIPNASAIQSGGRIAWDVRVDSGLDPMNAVEGTIFFSGIDTLSVQVRDGNSDIPLWIVHPLVDALGEVPFAGVIPGGRTGSVYVFTVSAIASATGTAGATLRDVRILKHDGIGTALPVEAISSAVLISSDAPQVTFTPVDRDVPEYFVPKLIHEPDFMHGAYVLVFVAQDKGTGIDRYEIFETPREITRTEDIQWESVTSSYVLRDQSLANFVYVKAVDRAGNERIELVQPGRTRTWLENPDSFAIILIGIVLGGICFLMAVLFPWKTKKDIWNVVSSPESDSQLRKKRDG